MELGFGGLEEMAAHRRLPTARTKMISPAGMLLPAACAALLGSSIAVVHVLGSSAWQRGGEVEVEDVVGGATVVTWFDRTSSPDPWLGRTYDEATEFCKSRDRDLCSHDTICPNGPGSLPVGGGFLSGDPTTGLAWTAISSDSDGGHNSWVQVGSKDHCLTYDFMHVGRGPEWGLTSSSGGRDEYNSEAMTGHVACCLPAAAAARVVVPNDDEQQQQDQEDSQKTLQEEAPPSLADAHRARDSQQPSRVINDMDPLWYDASDGWSGSTFEEALDFCLSQDTNRYPCPYEAYCPDGPQRHYDPAILEEDYADADYGGTTPSLWSWSPIIDEMGRGIVQVGGDGNGSYANADANGGTASCKIRYLKSEEEEEGGLLLLGRKGPGSSLAARIMCCSLV